MKKILLFNLLLFLCAQTLFAQNTNKISGTVVDKEGLPMEGVLVSAKGLNQNVVTDLDGYFSLDLLDTTKKLKFRYVGYQDRYYKAKDGMKIVFDKDDWYKGKPNSGHWFINPQVLVPTKFKNQGFGLMGGYIPTGHVGFYTKATIFLPTIYDNDYDEKSLAWGVTYGMLIRLSGSICLSLGLGATKLNDEEQYTYRYHAGYYEYIEQRYNQVNVDLGLLARYNHWCFNAGLYSWNPDLYGISFSDLNAKKLITNINLGVGYAF